MKTKRMQYSEVANMLPPLEYGSQYTLQSVISSKIEHFELPGIDNRRVEEYQRAEGMRIEAKGILTAYL